MAERRVVKGSDEYGDWYLSRFSEATGCAFWLPSRESAMVYSSKRRARIALSNASHGSDFDRMRIVKIKST